MSELIYKTAPSIVLCPVELRDVINDNETITTLCEAVLVEDEIYLTITFESSISGPEDTELDTIIASFACLGTDPAFDNGLVILQDDSEISTDTAAINMTGSVNVTATNGQTNIEILSGDVNYGQYAQTASNDAESCTTYTGWIRKLRMTTESLPSGTYRIGWAASLKSSSTSNRAQCRVQLNDSITINTVEEEPHDAYNWMPRAGFYYYTGSGVLNIDIDYSSTKRNASTKIRCARLEIWRVS